MGDEEATQIVRSRSRSPRPLLSKPSVEAKCESQSWAAKWRQALSRNLGFGDKGEPETKDTRELADMGDGNDEEVISENATDDKEASSENATNDKEAISENMTEEIEKEVENQAHGEEVRVEDIVYEYVSIGCGKGVHDATQLQHVLRASGCSFAQLFQAVVDHMSCLPGARSSLWCPGSDESVQWIGPANKVAALLRHLIAAGSESSSHAVSHRRLLSTLIELLLADPPESAECVQEWAGSCKLLAAAGPLLACPGAPAREAITKLQDEMLGAEANAPTGLPNCEDSKKDIEDVEPDPDAEKTKLRILGLDLTIDDTSGTALYENLPEDTGGAVEDGLGCALPTGGINALTTFDLTLSSDDEAPITGTAGAGEVDADDTFV